MKKIIILGLTGAGKTTLANKLGAMLDIPVFHLDQYFWKADWQHVSQAEFYAMQEKIIAENPAWILDGGFPRSKTLDLRIAHADTIILLDIPVVVSLWRMAKRYFQLRGIWNSYLSMRKNILQLYVWQLTILLRSLSMNHMVSVKQVQKQPIASLFTHLLFNQKF